MTVLLQIHAGLLALLDLGGWVVGVILMLSVLAGAVVLFKLVQFHLAGVGRHAALEDALAVADAGHRARALNRWTSRRLADFSGRFGRRFLGFSGGFGCAFTRFQTRYFQVRHTTRDLFSPYWCAVLGQIR